MAAMLITVETGELDIAALRHRFDKSHNRHRMFGGILNYLYAILGGNKSAFVQVELCSAYAAGYVDCDNSDAVNGTDELTVAGTVLAVEASPASEDQFAKGATDATFATNLAAAINAHTTLSKIVRAYVASSPTNRCHIVSRVPGPIGNLVTLAETGNGFVLSAAALASGAGDETDTLQMGYLPTGITA